MTGLTPVFLPSVYFFLSFRYILYLFFPPIFSVCFFFQLFCLFNLYIKFFLALYVRSSLLSVLYKLFINFGSFLMYGIFSPYQRHEHVSRRIPAVKRRWIPFGRQAVGRRSRREVE